MKKSMLRRIKIRKNEKSAVGHIGGSSPQAANGESGMMVVETVISFTAFVMVTVAVIYLTNLFTVHNKVQYAMNTAAQQIASYSYLYQALGLRDADQAVSSDGSSYVENIDSTAEQIIDSLNKIENLSSEFDSASESIQNIELDKDSLSSLKSELEQLKDDGSETASSVKSSATKIKELISNPEDLLVGVIYLGISGATYTAKSAFATAAAELLCEGYLAQGDQSADDYLKAYGITDGYDGLDFSHSTMFCDDDSRVIDLVVEYDIDLSFLSFVLPSTTVHMVQRVSVLAWVDGDGQTVSR